MKDFLCVHTSYFHNWNLASRFKIVLTKFYPCGCVTDWKRRWSQELANFKHVLKAFFSIFSTFLNQVVFINIDIISSLKIIPRKQMENVKTRQRKEKK